MFAPTPSLGLHSFAPRRLLTLAAAVLACVLLLNVASADADSSSSLTVVGTSDVSDSGLMPNVIQPQFEKAFPQFTFKYIGTATGTAISDAESGSAGASVLIVHAESLENEFVANGYSYEKYGRAIFINDFVLAGPKSDPAGVATNAAHNVAQAFADVAAAGINGKATFVSRGGTPGTTVQEHQIWQLVSSSGLAPTGLLLCAVNSTSGGGEAPIAAGHGVTASGQPCPNAGLVPTSSALPPWYVATGLPQGPNLQNANACNGYPSGANSCYVLTDRGTYDYLASGTDPAGSISNLQIVTRDDSASAPGGTNELINYFHAYIINPSKLNETVNLTAAQDFVNFLTSPTFQAQLKNYLPTGDPGGPPFKPDASPIISTAANHGIPRTYHANKRVTVTGTLTNAEPGYPPLAGTTVAIDELVGGLPVPVDTGKTNATGAFSITFKPTSTGSYELSTNQIAQIENSALTPPFGDLLSSAATTPIKVTVHSAITSVHVRSAGGKADVIGSVTPGSGHVKGSVKVMARRAGSKHGYKTIATDRLGANDGNFAVAVPLAAGRWQFKVTFQDPKRVVASTSRAVEATIGPGPSTSVSLATAKGKNGALTVAGNVKPSAGGVVELLALRTSGVPARFGVVAKTGIRGGKTKFTLHAKLKRRFRWMLQLEYLPAGQASSFSKLRAVTAR